MRCGQSGILPVLACSGNRPGRTHRQSIPSSVEVEQRFLKPSNVRHLPAASWVSERVTFLTCAPRRCATARGHGVSFLNQACTHLPSQVVRKIHAKDLDLFDRCRMRLCSQSRVRTSDQLAANSAGKSQSQLSRLWNAPAERSGDSALDSAFNANQILKFPQQHPERRRRFALPAHSTDLRKKINVKRVNC